MQRGEIRLHNDTVTPFNNYLVSRGIPLPPGAVLEPKEVSIVDADGRAIPSEGKVLQRRPDGSIEWMLADYLTSVGPDEKKSLFIELRPNERAVVEHPVEVRETDDAVTISNGITELTIGKSGSLIHHLSIEGKTIVAPEQHVDLEVVDIDGKIFRASVAPSYQVIIEHNNRLRATVKVEGKHYARDGSSFLDFALRFTLGANRPDVKFMHTFYCREPRTGVIEVKAIRLVIPTTMAPDAKKLIRQAHHGHSFFPRPVTISENVELISSSVSHVNNYASEFKYAKMGVVYVRNYTSFHEENTFYPFHMKPTGGSEFRPDYNVGGMRQIYRWVGWQQPDMTLVFSMKWWAQLHPKSVTIDENVLTVAIWPEWSLPLRIVQGVSKSHTFWLTGEARELSHDECEAHALQWEVQSVEPLDITFDPAWPIYCQAMDTHHLLRYQPRKYAKLEHLIAATPGEDDRFTYARNIPNGMFHFACISYGEPSWGNNEDDRRVFVPLRDYLRTGKGIHWDFGIENGEHYMEVDFCEWSTDPRQNGGLIPHTQDHFIGNVYPSHQWAEGILAFYYLTGDERARNVVIKVGENNIYWANNAMEVVACDGREAGIPLVNLAAAYRLTQDQRYIDAAKLIIDNFQKKWYEIWGDLKYPYPQGGHLKWTTGYGDYSSYYGLYRIWEVTGDEEIKTLLIELLKKALVPERFGINDSRLMDFMAAWAYIQLTGDKSILQTLKDPIENFLIKGGHEMRRLEFLNVLDQEGLIPT
jgi:hypothetical protein